MLSYHACCNTFSRRAFTKVAGHPPILSIGVLKIPGLRNATSHQDLYHWLLDIIIKVDWRRNESLLPEPQHVITWTETTSITKQQD